MSLPNLPDFNPDLLNPENAAILLLSSIAYEEFALAHIINAEAEKIQATVGTLTCDNQCIFNEPMAADLDDLLDMNESVNNVLQSVIKKEMLLQFKFENVLKFLYKIGD